MVVIGPIATRRVVIGTLSSKKTSRRQCLSLLWKLRAMRNENSTRIVLSYTQSVQAEICVTSAPIGNLDGSQNTHTHTSVNQ